MSYRSLWEFASCRHFRDNQTGHINVKTIVLYWDRGLHVARHDWQEYRLEPPQPQDVLPYLGLPRLAREIVYGIGDMAAVLVGR